MADDPREPADELGDDPREPADELGDDPRERADQLADGEPPADEPRADELADRDEPAAEERADRQQPPADELAPDAPSGRSARPRSEGADPAVEDHESAYSLLQRGQALLKSRHHAQAAIVLERAARAEPGKGSILEPLGRAYHHSGQFEQARETFEKLLEVDPSAHWAHFAIATTLRKLDRVPEARTHLRLAVALSPTTKLYREALDRLPPPEEKPDAA